MQCDLAVIGSGFGGSLTALVARRLGLSVVLLERGVHPRFVIGESTSPLTNLLLEELARGYHLPRLLPLTEYGRWRRAYPGLPVGLKRGFTFYQHRPGEDFQDLPDRSRQLLVAASPRDELADTHWLRADFDAFLVREAVDAGADYRDRFTLTEATEEPEGMVLTGNREGRAEQVRARFVVDASGARGALARLLGLRTGEVLPGFPATQALFSHFTGVGLFAEQVECAGAPYPPDAAALHHVFPGGWMWVLRFDNGVTSAGFAVEDGIAEELAIREGEPAWRRFLARFPSIGRQFRAAVPIQPWVHMPRLAFRTEPALGRRWALLPSAAGFVDPLFSTGFPLTLLGIHRLGRALRERPDDPAPVLEREGYAETAREEVQASALLVGGCYRLFEQFPEFAGLSMLYFGAASFAEMARRLGRSHLVTRFLLQNRPGFREGFRRCCTAALSGGRPSPEEVAEVVRPVNVAGLCDPAKRNWYGVDLEDLVRAADRLEAGADEVREFVRRMGW